MNAIKGFFSARQKRTKTRICRATNVSQYRTLPIHVGIIHESGNGLSISSSSLSHPPPPILHAKDQIKERGKDEVGEVAAKKLQSKRNYAGGKGEKAGKRKG